MQYSIVAIAVFATSVLANSHNWGVCAKNIRPRHPGGTPWSPGMGPIDYDFDQLEVATANACKAYRAQTGGYDCPDCVFENGACHSASKHLGGKEWHRYCLAENDPEGKPTGTIVT